MTDKPTREARYVRAEETTACPRCGAQPGDQCRTTSGRWRRNPHKVRIHEAEWLLADPYAAREAEQREAAEPDPLDEDDHRDRVTASGRTLRRHGWKHWHSEEGSGFRCSHQPCVGVLTLSGWGSWDGPLTFTPEPPPEAKQREAAEPDPLDEDDHRDRLDRDGGIWVRNPRGCFHIRRRDCRDLGCKWTLAFLNEHYGPLTFTPEPPPDATGDDLSASEGESGSVEGEGADDPSEALLCPGCADHINTHGMSGCQFAICACPRTPEDVARPLIAEAVKAERERLARELRELADAHRRATLDLVHYKKLHSLAARWGQQ